MLTAYKTELDPTAGQAEKIRQTIGTCRNVYNMFINVNKERHGQGLPFMSGYDFSKWLNNEYLKQNPDKTWMKQVSSKAVKHAIMTADTAFQKFFKGKARYPRFKKKGRTDPGAYLPNGNFSQNKPLIEIERHRIKLPTFGWVRLKEKGYVPYRIDPKAVKSATVSYKAGRYYVSVLVDIETPVPSGSFSDGIGIDLGIKNLAAVSTEQVFRNINKTPRVKAIEKRLRRKQRCLSRKYESLKRRSKKIKERKSYSTEYPKTKAGNTETVSKTGTHQVGLYQQVYPYAGKNQAGLYNA